MIDGDENKGRVDLGLEELIRVGSIPNGSDIDNHPQANESNPVNTLNHYAVSDIFLGSPAEFALKMDWSSLITWCEMAIKEVPSGFSSAPEPSLASLPELKDDAQTSSQIKAQSVTLSEELPDGKKGLKVLSLNQEARCWWIRAQLLTKGVPISIVAGPLESLSEDLIKSLWVTVETDLSHNNALSDPSITPDTESFCLKKGEVSLTPREELVLRIVIASLNEVADLLTKDQSRAPEPDPSNLIALGTKLSGFVSKNEIPSYFFDVLQKLQIIGDEVQFQPVAAQPGAAQPVAAQLVAEPITNILPPTVEDAHEDDTQARLAASWRPLTPASHYGSNRRSEVTERGVGGRSVEGGGLGKLLFFAIPTLLGLIGIWWWLQRLTVTTEAPSITTIFVPDNPKLALPNVKRASFDTALDLVYYEVAEDRIKSQENLASNDSEVNPVRSSDTSGDNIAINSNSAPVNSTLVAQAIPTGSVPREATISTSTPSQHSQQESKVKVKEKVRTDGPIEPDGLKATIKVTPRSFPTAYINRRENTSRLVARSSEHQSPTIRLPLARNESKDISDNDTSNNDTSDRAEIKTGTTAGFYRILTSTEVMSKPSPFGAPVAILRRGDKVRVERLNGEWLKLASKNGRPGFIKRQDAMRD